MRYLALSTDYDGTLAHHGSVDDATLAALERLRGSGRKLVLVTGRELDQLMEVFPHLDLFDRVVAENGALLYRPECREEKCLAERPPEAFVARLKARGVGPISVGRVIVATWEPHQTAVLETIRELGLELQVIFNKGAVMVLPSGVNKATGLTVALEELCLSLHNAVGIGDAENDHAFLAVCECSAAVANALPSLQERADLVTRAGHGAGVMELIDRLLEDDLASLANRLTRHAIRLGTPLDAGGNGAAQPVTIEPYGINVLVSGTSGSGKSTLTTGLLERLSEQGYQFLIVDPEGDYAELEFATVLGDPHRAPLVEEVVALAQQPRQNVVVNLLGIALEHRPEFFARMLPRLHELRARTGRPHWIVVDEAHHLLPASWDPSAIPLPREPQGMLFITVHPESMLPDVVASADVLLAVGSAPARTVRDFCRAAGRPVPEVEDRSLAAGEVLMLRKSGGTPVRVRSEPPRAEHSRHSRKYAEGNLGPDRSFRFRGPEGKLDLKAQNLVIFLQMADGVDDATWLHHLRRGDLSAWFRYGIKDDELAADAERIERQADQMSPRDSRAAIREAIEARFTLPADQPSGLVTPGS